MIQHLRLLSRNHLLWVCGLTVLFSSLPQKTNAQAPAWQVAFGRNQNIGNALFESVTAIDSDGNVYSAGSFRGTVNFGSISLTSAGGADVFVVKWSRSSKTIVWAQRAGGTGDDSATGLAISGTSVYVTGTFYSATAGFGSISLNNATSTNSGGDLFVAKISDSGNFVWAQQAGGSGNELDARLAVEGTAIYLAGTSDSPAARFGALTLTGPSMFVVKCLDEGSTGRFAWAQQSTGSVPRPRGMAISGASIYVVGEFNSNAVFGSAALVNTTAIGTTDGFVAKLMDSGNTGGFQWAHRIGGAYNECVQAVAAEGSNVFITGDFQSNAATFGNSPATLNNADSQGFSRDFFAAKLTDAGGASTFAWAQRGGGTGTDAVQALAVDGSSVYVAGWFSSPSTIHGNTTLLNADPTGGYGDVFVTKLVDTGSSASLVWAQQAGGVNEDGAQALAINGAGLYVAGYVSYPATFGNSVISGPANVYDGFFAALNDPTITASIPNFTPTELSVYPNPTQGNSILRLSGALGNSQGILSLIDGQGRIVLTQDIALASVESTVKVVLTDVKPGLYYLLVQACRQRWSRALVVE